MHPSEIPSVPVADVAADAVLLDVREPAEWAAGHIEGAVHMPMNSVPARLQYDPGAIAPDIPVVVVCKVGGRSAQVTAWLRHHGYDAVNLEGGMLAWQGDGRPMVADGDAAPEVL